ncbi:MAG TPA: energy transducer TonB [Candidatus Sulfotelmatobacter sp.]|nr:energy transducer TonB [Candidatus Sulfotelmatobacter sp.]
MANLLPRSILFLFLCASLAAAQEPSRAPLEVPTETQRTYPVKKVAPVYPPLARQARIQGTVILRAVISKSGDVGNIQLISGHPLLAPAAIEAVKQWKYQPYLMDGMPFEVETKVQINFKLDKEPPPEGVIGDAPGGLPPGAIGAVANGGAVMRVSEPVMRAMRIAKIDAVYPPLALQAGIEGTVVLDVQIGKNGDVERVTVLTGHPMLVPAAIEAGKQWKYRPYLLNGEPVNVDTTINLHFSHGEVSEPDLSSGAPDASAPAGEGLIRPQRVRVSSGVEAGLIVSKVAPEYPQEAREQHIQGTIVLMAIVDKERNVANLELISGHPTLAAAAIEAVKHWKYKPHLLNGNPVEVETQVQVNFTLRE